eukprot:13663789-Alexandrium_andersonii.AAC.1
MAECDMSLLGPRQPPAASASRQTLWGVSPPWFRPAPPSMWHGTSKTAHAHTHTHSKGVRTLTHTETQ